ncbi:helix-turn-helix domain-containing protein [Streptomyces platensis]|uniref:MmyB family transcriptional regulator n=1 Tax=Streptomyces platensis TaxID=58346 RepID=UPI00386A3580|nr:helix-turn-helix transcriptional regulator [Streptomyces platensis]
MSIPESLLESISFPGLLRTWRAEAGKKMGLGKALSQKQVAERMKVSERWYRSLESGQAISLSGPVLKRLAAVLALGPDDRITLYAQAFNGTCASLLSVESRDMEARGGVAEMAKNPGPNPVYVVDKAWNVISFNPKMSEWFPEMCQPSSNLLRWAFSEDGRSKLVEWHRNAEVYLGQLRFSLANHPESRELHELLEYVLSVPEGLAIWKRNPRLVAYREGECFRLRIPCVSPRDFSVVARVLLPPYQPGIRYVTLIPHQEELAPCDARHLAMNAV